MMGEEDGSGAEGKLDHSMLLTDPDEAADFVKKTNVDALAIAIGTSHGAYKFTRPPTGDILAIKRNKFRVTLGYYATLGLKDSFPKPPLSSEAASQP